MRATSTTSSYRLFGRSDLIVAALGSLMMALAGAGLASWFGPGVGSTAHADVVSASGETAP